MLFAQGKEQAATMGILDDLKARFGGGEPALPADPPGFETGDRTFPESPDLVLSAPPEPEPLLEGLTVGITYRDSEGEESERLVNSISLVDTPDGRVLWAYCHLQRDFCAFYLDRITQVRDYRTGAHTDDAERFFAPYVTPAHAGRTHDADDTSRATREVLGLIGDELRILAFVAMSDRYFDEREEQLISDFIRERARQLGEDIAESYDHAWVLNWLHAQNPTFDGLERAVDRLSQIGEWELRALWDLSKDLVHADDRVDKDELRAMDELYTAIDHAISERRAEMG